MNHLFVSNRVFALSALVFLFVACGSNEGPDQTPVNNYLVDVTVEKRISRTQIIAGIDDAFPQFNIGTSPFSAMIKDVDVAAITYKTKGVDGKPIVASGVIVIPVETVAYDYLLSIQHGTCDMEKAPSLSLFTVEMIPVIGNKIVVMADYQGYGVSQTPDRQHPYLHTKSTGIVCADMIEAAREYLASKQIKQKSDQIELIGYSQGATSTIATLYELESRGQASRIRSVHAGGGTYDLVSTMTSLISSGMVGGNSSLGYFPYIVRGMNFSEQLGLDDTKIYSSELIDRGVLTMFSTKPLSELHELLGTDVTKVIHPDFFFPPLFNNNVEIGKLVAALTKNSLVKNDAPATAVNLYHSRTDETVPYDNSSVAAQKWGAKLTDLTLNGHIPAGMEFLLRYMGLWEMIKPA